MHRNYSISSTILSFILLLRVETGVVDTTFTVPSTYTFEYMVRISPVGHDYFLAWVSPQLAMCWFTHGLLRRMISPNYVQGYIVQLLFPILVRVIVSMCEHWTNKQIYTLFKITRCAPTAGQTTQYLVQTRDGQYKNFMSRYIMRVILLSR